MAYEGLNQVTYTYVGAGGQIPLRQQIHKLKNSFLPTTFLIDKRFVPLRSYF